MDRAGLGLALALATWALLGAGDVGGARRWPFVALVAGCVAAAAAGRWMGRCGLPVLPGVALTVGVVMVAALPGLDHPIGPPLGYANANATLASLGVVAAGGMALSVPATEPTRRENWSTAAAVLGVFVVIPSSRAGLICLAVAAALTWPAWRWRRPELAAAAGALVVGLVLLATVALALGADPAGFGDRTGARGDLWSGAVDLVEEHPVRGIGPGAFAGSNPVTDDPDLRWVHHEYLQVAAELGVPGLALVLALAGGAFLRLGLAARLQPEPAVPALVGVAALTIVALHATVDYLLHLVGVPLVAALLLGWATAPAGRT